MTQYQVTAVWWPDGWEPQAPLDVPNCLRRAEGANVAPPLMDLEQAWATVRGLNRQNMDRPGAVWYVVTEASAAPTGDEESLRVVRSAEGGRGDCSHCPAHHFPCAAEATGR